MNNKCLILHPEDKTTEFLDGIILDLRNNVDNKLFEVIKIGCHDDAHEAAISEIRKNIYSTIVFLGHGTSGSLKGAKNDGYEKGDFISFRDLSMFKDKSVIFISCESAALLKHAKQVCVSGIGFGDLPTDFNDIRAAREVDANAYTGFTQDTIDAFRNVLIKTITYSLRDYLSMDMSMHSLRNAVVLRLNKKIATNYKKKEAGYAILNDCLFEVKNQIIFFNNNGSNNLIQHI